MQRSTLVLGAVVLLAAVLIVLDRPESAPATGVVPAGAAAGGTAAQLPDGHPPVNSAVPLTGSAGPLATVLEVMESGGYTYARVETGGEEIWAAGPPSPLEVGMEVTLGGAMGMENFTAASLDRTFDRILFVNTFGSATPGGGAGSGAGAGGIAGSTGGAAGSATGGAAGSATGGAAGSLSPGGPAVAGPGAGSGTVLEVTHAAEYSFIRIETDDGDLWLAGNQIEIDEGQTVSWNGGAMMQNFNSPTLGRTFERILFADGLRAGG